MRACVLAVVLLGAVAAAEAAFPVRASPSLPKNWQANVTVAVVPENGPQFNFTAHVYEDSTNGRSRFDETRGIVFEQLLRFDLNMSYNIAEGHCFANALFTPFESYFAWLSDATIGNECHGGNNRPAGTAYLQKAGSQTKAVCLSLDGTTPYWYEHTEAKRGTKVFFNDFTPGLPAASVFAVPSSCQQAQKKL